MLFDFCADRLHEAQVAFERRAFDQAAQRFKQALSAAINEKITAARYALGHMFISRDVLSGAIRLSVP